MLPSRTLEAEAVWKSPALTASGEKPCLVTPFACPSEKPTHRSKCAPGTAAGRKSRLYERPSRGVCSARPFSNGAGPDCLSGSVKSDKHWESQESNLHGRTSANAARPGFPSPSGRVVTVGRLLPLPAPAETAEKPEHLTGRLSFPLSRGNEPCYP